MFFRAGREASQVSDCSTWMPFSFLHANSCITLGAHSLSMVLRRPAWSRQPSPTGTATYASEPVDALLHTYLPWKCVVTVLDADEVAELVGDDVRVLVNEDVCVDDSVEVSDDVLVVDTDVEPDVVRVLVAVDEMLDDTVDVCEVEFVGVNVGVAESVVVCVVVPDVVLDVVSDDVTVVLGDVKLQIELSRPSFSAVRARLSFDTVNAHCLLSRKYPWPAHVSWACVLNANSGRSPLILDAVSKQSSDLVVSSSPDLSQASVPFKPLHASSKLFKSPACRSHAYGVSLATN